MSAHRSDTLLPPSLSSYSDPLSFIPTDKSFDYLTRDGSKIGAVTRRHRRAGESQVLYWEVRLLENGEHANVTSEDLPAIPYRLPELPATGGEVILVADEPTADMLWQFGFPATCNPGGVDLDWPARLSGWFRGREVVILNRDDADTISERLMPHAVNIRIQTVSGLSREWLAGSGADRLRALIAEAPRKSRTQLSEVLEAYARYFCLPDPSALILTLAAYAANQLPGPPVWVLFVGPPAGGKTAIIGSVASLPNVHPTGSITVAGLLSGTGRKDKSTDATGGLLRKIGEHGIILLKDFGSVLEMPRDSRAPLLMALRELYDGHWTRTLGTDGGQEFSWKGRLGLIGAVTSAIDQAHGVLGLLGERFLLFRLPKFNREDQARAAINQLGMESDLKGLESVVQQFVRGLDLNPQSDLPDIDDRERIIKLADFSTRARSAVPRDFRDRTISDLPETEAPARLAKALMQLLRGLDVIGNDRASSWRILGKAALDCLPAIRLRIIRTLNVSATPMSTSEIATAVGCPTITTLRALEDLTAHEVTERLPEKVGNAYVWQLTECTIEQYKTIEN